MLVREAVDIVMAYGVMVGATNLMDCVEKMQDALDNGELSPMQSVAFNIYIGELEAIAVGE